MNRRSEIQKSKKSKWSKENRAQKTGDNSHLKKFSRLSIALYIATIAMELLIFKPLFTLGLNIPIILAVYFNLYNYKLFVKFRSLVDFDASFLFILLIVGCIILLISMHTFVASLGLVLTVCLFWTDDLFDNFN